MDPAKASARCFGHFDIVAARPSQGHCLGADCDGSGFPPSDLARAEQHV